jgi:hypothetical protein
MDGILINHICFSVYAGFHHVDRFWFCEIFVQIDIKSPSRETAKHKSSQDSYEERRDGFLFIAVVDYSRDYAE